jgi:TetR/AcrR family transcriptional repressor of mexJK operon
MGVTRRVDPRVVRSRSAVVEAARVLFLEKGYAGTTMAEIAAVAGLTKRTVYNNYPDKRALFTMSVVEVTAFADAFARDLRQQFEGDITADNLGDVLNDLGQRLALGIVRAEVIAIRRLLIGEAREFPKLAETYFERAPGQVLDALAAGFSRLAKARVLRVTSARVAAAQFAYLVAGEPLDRAVLVGTVPSRKHVIAGAREGVNTFLARYAP